MVTLQPETELRQGADAHWVATNGAGSARCSLWWSHVPEMPGQRLGVVGHYEAADADAAIALLDHAAAVLREQGCTLAVGPMDGSTWRRYRLITERGAEPPFFLEPDNPDAWPRHFAAAGFAPLATYTSAITDDLVTEDARIDRVTARLRSQGLLIRPLDLGHFDGELATLFRLSLRAFADNFLYTPIAPEEFAVQYSVIRPYLRPELVLIAEYGGEAVGFLFAVPNLAQAKLGQPVDTVIVKTLAADPRYAGRGLGSVLLAEVNRAAAALGFRRAIHALMHETNQSTRISARQAHVFRRYTLFARAL